ncbi:MAG: hypothetical protein ACYCY0_08085 [Acidithiobacillus ferrivorans]
MRDPQYLRFATNKTVEDINRKGIRTFCLLLDIYADEYELRVFRQLNYLVLAHADKKPWKLPQLYIFMTK